MGAAGTARATVGAGSVPRTSPGLDAAPGDGVEVVRAKFGLGHRHGRCVLGEALAALGQDGGEDLARTLWLDTETTGLAGGTGTYAFLVGVAYVDGDALITEQFLLRRLSAEHRLLAALAARLGARRLVTFNGQRFDWPILEARFVLARQSPAVLDAHTDLIYPARRLWHRVLGTHRLSAIEAEVLGAPRDGDIPGWEIPMRYVDYLRTTDRAALNPILIHNRADLLALVLLHGEVARILRDPHAAGVPLDWEGAGVLLGRQGRHEQAVDCLARAVGETDEPGARWRILRRLTRAHRLIGDPDGARARWEDEAVAWRRPDRLRAHVLEEVAKGRAKQGDIAGAKAATEEALALASWLNRDARFVPATLSRLADRLRTRLARFDDRHG